MKPKNPCIHFTDEERASPELKKPIRKADKAADRVDAVRKKARLRFDEDAPKVPSKLTHEVQKAPGKLLSEEVHRNIKSAEDENVGVEAAHGVEQTAETALHMSESAYHTGRLKPYRDVARAEQRLGKANVDVLIKRLCATIRRSRPIPSPASGRKRRSRNSMPPPSPAKPRSRP